MRYLFYIRFEIYPVVYLQNEMFGAPNITGPFYELTTFTFLKFLTLLLGKVLTYAKVERD